MYNLIGQVVSHGDWEVPMLSVIEPKSTGGAGISE